MVAVEWSPVPGVRALCTSRVGGMSAVPWNWLNLGLHVGDAPELVLENRQRLRTAAGLPAEPRWLQQVHGTVVADLDAPASGSTAAFASTADAAVSCNTGTVCAVMVADCLPVMFAAMDGSVVGVAHAGWRGLAAGVIENTVRALRQRARDVPLLALLGPAISVRHFEVGNEVREAFLVADAAAASAFQAGEAGRWQCDLYALARQRLAALAIPTVLGGGLCTYADANRFFSHRRDVQHRGLASTGRMAALIWRT